MTAPEQPTPEALELSQWLHDLWARSESASHITVREGARHIKIFADRFAAQRAAVESARSSAAERGAHNADVAGSTPVGHTTVVAVREAHHAGWDDFRDTVKPRIFEAPKPFEIADAVEILNRHHYAQYGRALAATPPPGDAGERARRLVNDSGPLHSPSPWHVVGNLDAAAQAIADFAQSERTAAASQARRETTPLIDAALDWLHAGDALTAAKGDRLPANKSLTEAHIALRKAAEEYRTLATPPQEPSNG